MTREELKSIKIGQKIRYSGDSKMPPLSPQSEIWTVYGIDTDDPNYRVSIKSNTINSHTAEPFKWWLDKLDCKLWHKIEELVDLI